MMCVHRLDASEAIAADLKMRRNGSRIALWFVFAPRSGVANIRLALGADGRGARMRLRLPVRVADRGRARALSPLGACLFACTLERDSSLARVAAPPRMEEHIDKNPSRRLGERREGHSMATT